MIAVILAACFWATSGIFIREVLEAPGMTPALLAFWRDLATFLVLVLWRLISSPKTLDVRASDFFLLAAMGTILGLFHVFWNIGVLYNGPAVTTVQQAATPAIITVAARLLWNESVDWKKGGAILLTFIGTAMTAFGGQWGAGSLTTTGLAIGFGVPLSYAGWSMLGKRLRSRYSAPTILTYAFGFAALALSPVQMTRAIPVEISFAQTLCFAGLIFVSTIGAFLLFTFGIGRIPVSTASILAMSEIFFVSVFTILILGDPVSGRQGLGGALVVCGVLMLLWPRRRAQISS